MQALAFPSVSVLSLCDTKVHQPLKQCFIFIGSQKNFPYLHKLQTYVSGHILCLCLRCEIWIWREIYIFLLQCSDQVLTAFWSVICNLHRSAIQMLYPRHLMDPAGSQRILGKVHSNLVGSSDWMSHWQWEASQAVDKIAPSNLFLLASFNRLFSLLRTSGK